MKAGSWAEAAFGLALLGVVALLVEYWFITLGLGVLVFVRVIYGAWLGTERQQEKRAQKRTHQLYAEVCTLYDQAPVENEDALRDFLSDVSQSFAHFDKELRDKCLEAVYELYVDEGFRFSIPPPPVHCNSVEGARYRDQLNELSTQLVRPNRKKRAASVIKESFTALGRNIPAYRDGDVWGLIPLTECDGIGGAVENMLLPIYRDEVSADGLFEKLKRTLDANLYEVSGIAPEQDSVSSSELTFPSAYDGPDVVHVYLKDTPFEKLFYSHIPFRVPTHVRFEHTMIVAGSGHGKTTLLSNMILSDIEKAKAGGGGFAVIDPKGSLVSAVAQLECFAPEGPLHDRLVIIDPWQDVDYPPAINMFDLGVSSSEVAGNAERLAVRNNALEMIEYMFSELLKVEMTGRQEVAFNYVGDLMMNIEGATVKTLLDFLNNPQNFIDAIARCDPTTRDYLEHQFITDRFRSVRDQLSDRVYGVLKLPMMEAMFSHAKTKVDVSQAVNEGKIVLINANESFLSSNGSSVFGSVWIGLLFQACLSRIAIPKDERKPFTLYIDEASMFFSEKLRQMLVKAREGNLGVVFAFQDLGQIEDLRLRSSALGSTSTKFVGGLNANDRQTFAKEMNTTEQRLRRPQKDTRLGKTEFATYVRGVTPEPVTLSFELGVLDAESKMSSDEFDDVVEINRKRVSYTDSSNVAENTEYENSAVQEQLADSEQPEPQFTYEEEITNE